MYISKTKWVLTGIFAASHYTQFFMMCLFTVAVVFLNAACSSKNSGAQGDKGIVIQVETEREPPIEFVRSPVIVRQGKLYPGTKTQTEVKPKLSCSHQVGSTVRQGESIRLTYKTANASLDATLTLTAGRLGYDGESINLPQQIAKNEANKVEICWGEDNCFVATKNRDGSWTLKSLPFQ